MGFAWVIYINMVKIYLIDSFNINNFEQIKKGFKMSTDRIDNIAEEYDFDVYGLQDFYYVKKFAHGRDITIDTKLFWDLMYKRFLDEERTSGLVDNYKLLRKD